MSMRKMVDKLKTDDRKMQMTSEDMDDDDDFGGFVEEDDGESESEDEGPQRKDRPQHNRQRGEIFNDLFLLP